MDKKGVFGSFITDLLGLAFFLIGLVLWTFLFTVSKASISADISDVPYISDELAMIAYLKTPTGNGILLDEILAGYRYGDTAELNSTLSSSLNSVYGRAKPACWKLWYYDDNEERNLVAQEECSETKELFDREMVVPLPYNPEKRSMKVQITVPGYK